MKHKSVVLIATLSVSLSACASIVSKSDWPVAIQSTPTGLPFTITNREGVEISSGKTPQTITLKSSSGYFSPEHYNIEFNNHGKTISRDLTADLNGWYIGNLVFGSLIGFLIVDPLTGAMYRLPESVMQNMQNMPKDRQGNNTHVPPSLRVMSLADLSPQQRKQLQPLQ